MTIQHTDCHLSHSLECWNILLQPHHHHMTKKGIDWWLQDRWLAGGHCNLIILNELSLALNVEGLSLE